MKNKLLLTAALISFVNIAASAQVIFTEKPFDMIVAQAKESSKYVLVDAYTDWCGWCKVMDRETFSDSIVGDFINERFVSTKVDMEVGTGIDMAMKFRVSSYPHYLLFNKDGQLIAKLAGFMKPEPFMEAIDEALRQENWLPPTPNPMNFTEGYPDFLRNSYKKSKERINATPEEIQEFLAAQDDLTDEVSWAVINRYVGGGEYAIKTIENREVLIQKYGKKEVIDKLASFVFSDVKQAIKDKDEELLKQALYGAENMLGDEADNYKSRYQLYYYQMTEDWVNYGEVAQDVSKNEKLNDPGTLNQMAWTIYEKSTAPESVKNAIKWMEEVVAEDPKYAYLDTYAALLFKDNQKEKALQYAEMALAAGEAEEQKTEETQVLIDKIKML